ncbi:MAG: hypothetical protein ACOCZ9_03260 [Spirochaetota bacterium]
MSAKARFVGAGRAVFAKNVIGDVLVQNELSDIDRALYDIDEQRLEDSVRLVNALRRKESFEC